MTGHAISRRYNNKKCTANRGIQYAPKYTKKQIENASSTIEKYRMARCVKNIKVNC